MIHKKCISCGSSDLTIFDSQGYGDVYLCNAKGCKNRFNESCDPYVEPKPKKSLTKRLFNILFYALGTGFFVGFLLWASKGLVIVFVEKISTNANPNLVWWAAGWLSCIVFGSTIGSWKWNDK